MFPWGHEVAYKISPHRIKSSKVCLMNLMDLMNLLKLDELPKRIESYDISNISGTDIVGGMVVFENAKPKKNEYRRLKIKTVSSIYKKCKHCN